MDRVFIFLIRNDVWIYILCGLGLFWYGTDLLRALGQRRRAMFNLERERATQRRNHALTLVLLCASVAGAVAFVNVRIAPTLPAELLRSPTPTPDPLRQPLASPTPRLAAPPPAVTPTPPLVPTITLPGGPVAPPPVQTPGTAQTVTPDTPEPGETPAPPVAIPGNCPPSINFSLPLDGSTVSGLVTFTGNASAPGFAFYKIEINGPETGGQWASLLGRTVFQPTVNGVLGSADFAGWQPGSYAVRLVVVDDTSNEVGACTIQLAVGG